MALIHYFIAAVIIILAILISVYIIINPLNKSVTKINYPYSLSLKPMLISTAGSINISVSTLKNDVNLLHKKSFILL